MNDEINEPTIETGRDSRGRVVRGNTLARTHGLSAYKRHGVLPPEVAQQEREFGAQVIADLGGVENLSTLEMGLVGNISCTFAQLNLLGAFLMSAGPTTAKGHVRQRVLNSFLAATAAYQRDAMKLGLERRPKRTPDTAFDISAFMDEDEPEGEPA